MQTDSSKVSPPSDDPSAAVRSPILIQGPTSDKLRPFSRVAALVGLLVLGGIFGWAITEYSNRIENLEKQVSYLETTSLREPSAVGPRGDELGEVSLQLSKSLSELMQLYSKLKTENENLRHHIDELEMKNISREDPIQQPSKSRL